MKRTTDKITVTFTGDEEVSHAENFRRWVSVKHGERRLNSVLKTMILDWLNEQKDTNGQ